MKDILAPLYNYLLNPNNYEYLYDISYHFNHLFFLFMIIVPIPILIIFYKIWDPVSSQRRNFFLTVFVLSIASYLFTEITLYSNVDIIMYVENGGTVDYFNQIMGITNFFLQFIPSFIFAIIIRVISSNNRHNPF